MEVRMKKWVKVISVLVLFGTLVAGNVFAKEPTSGGADGGGGDGPGHKKVFSPRVSVK
jgi:hypothetical protein